MEVKNKRFFALPHMERATKLLICLSVFLLINCGNVFATQITTDKILEVVQEYKSDYVMSDRIKNRLNLAISEHEYCTIMINETGLARNYIYVYFYNEILPITGNGQVKSSSQNITEITIQFNITDTYYGSLTNVISGYFIDPSKWYTESGFYTSGTTTFATGFEPGATNMEVMNTYKIPYFEFTINEVGTGSFEDDNEKIKVYEYKNKDLSANSMYSMLKVGELYIDKNYIFEDLYMPIPKIYKYNLDFSDVWQYDCFTIYTEAGNNIVDDYKVYNVYIDLNYISTPYYYELVLTSSNPELSNDMEIKFVLLKEELNQSTIGGITITTPSGDIISGEQIKDNTSLGDIRNDLTEPYNPNSSILNEMNSGDILENLGYETQTDPNQHIWDTIVNGMKDVLCGSGDQVLIFEFKGKQYPVKSSQINQPEGVLKIFTGLAVDFFLLMQMYQFIKKTIDQINEGDLKVMHDVDADCYFF